MNGWERRLRAAGGRLTSQRRVIVSILQGQSRHLSADEIYLLARQQQARLSLATVYRTLQWLKDSGLVCELRLNGNRCLYVIERGEAHQYMVCLGCGDVIQFACAHTPAVYDDPAEQHGRRGPLGTDPPLVDSPEKPRILRVSTAPGWRSGQTHQTVNLAASAYTGSSPVPGTIRETRHPRWGCLVFSPHRMNSSSSRSGTDAR